MLYFIGLGLADEKDITVKGLEIVKNASRVYLEAYTAILLVEKDRLVSRISRTPSLALGLESLKYELYEMFTTTSRKPSMADP
jgi:diphthamide biosynthesis methyltransferase